MKQNDISGNLIKWNQINRYSRWMYDIYKRYIGDKDLDIGAGIGNMTNYYINDCKQVIACDIFEYQLSVMRDRFSNIEGFQAVNWNILEDSIDLIGNQDFDTIICINVLEHLKDDKFALSKMKQLITQKGRIILLVPACPKLYCYMDKNVGHHRRYAKGELKRLAEDVGLSVVVNHYFNFLGIIPYYLKGRRGKDLGGSFSTDLNESNSRLYNIASTIMEPIERLIKPPIWISELIVLEKE